MKASRRKERSGIDQISLFSFFAVLILVSTIACAGIASGKKDYYDLPSLHSTTFINDTIPINIVFVGLNESAGMEEDINDWVMTTINPVDLERSIQQLSIGGTINFYDSESLVEPVSAGVAYDLDIQYYHAPISMEVDLSNFITDSMYLEKNVRDFRNYEGNYYLEDFYDAMWGEDYYFDEPVHNIEAVEVEQWLYSNTASYTGLENVLTETTLFFLEPGGVGEQYYLSKNGTDLDTNEEFQVSNLNAYGGTYDFFFIDLLALPPSYGDAWDFGDGSNEEAYTSLREYSPLWYYKDSEGSGMTEELRQEILITGLANLINESIQFIFIPSYLYTPRFDDSIDIQIYVYDCTANNELSSGVEGLVNESLVNEAFSDLVEYSKVTTRMEILDIDHEPQMENALDFSTFIAFDEENNRYTVIDSESILPYMDDVVAKNSESFVAPVFLYIYDNYAAVDDYYIRGSVVEDELFEPWGLLIAAGLKELQTGDGLTFTVIHEVGHILGLFHPHDALVPSRDQGFGLALSTRWFWDFSLTPMTYHEEMKGYGFSTQNKDTLHRGHTLWVLRQALNEWRSANETWRQKGYWLDEIPALTKNAMIQMEYHVGKSVEFFKAEQYAANEGGEDRALEFALGAWQWSRNISRLVAELPLLKLPEPDIEVTDKDLGISEDITISGAESMYVNGNITHYFYDLGDGNTTGWVTDSSISHSYSEEGTYFIRLKVRGENGVESEWSRLVMITVRENGRKDMTMSPLLPIGLVVLAVVGIVAWNWDKIMRNVKGDRASGKGVGTQPRGMPPGIYPNQNINPQYGGQYQQYGDGNQQYAGGNIITGQPYNSPPEGYVRVYPQSPPNFYGTPRGPVQYGHPPPTPQRGPPVYQQRNNFTPPQQGYSGTVRQYNSSPSPRIDPRTNSRQFANRPSHNEHYRDPRSSHPIAHGPPQSQNIAPTERSATRETHYNNRHPNSGNEMETMYRDILRSWDNPNQKSQDSNPNERKKY